MASILPRFLFFSLLLHSILLVNCDEEDDLLRGINQYRTSLNLTPLNNNDRVECLADEIADRTFNDRPCPSSSGPNGPPGSEPPVTDYPDLITKCRLDANVTRGAIVLPVCVPRLEPGPVLSSYTMSRYASFLNDTRFSDIGIGSDDDWIVVVLTMNTSTGSFSPGSGDEEDDLLRGINQYRTSQSLTALIDNDRVECLADEVADRVFNNQPCTNSSGPNGPPGSEPKVSDYPDIITKCRLNANDLQNAQILPVCVPRLQPGPVLSNYTMSRYATYLNDTRFSNIGIGSEDDWIVVVLTSSTSNGSFSPGNGSLPPGNGSFTPGNDDEEDNLLRGINQYRTSQNLTALIENDRVECLADEVADRTFNNQPCTNTSGPNGRPGSEPRVSDYPDLITKCRLNTNALQDAQILPVCVPRLKPGPVLSNYTMSRYAAYLNDTQFSAIGIGSEDDWIVVVLTTSTPNGSFSPGSGSPGSGFSNGASGIVPISPVVFFVIGLFFVLF